MKKFISIILALACTTVQVYAEKLNNEVDIGLFAANANRLVSVYLSENDIILPDFYSVEGVDEISVDVKNKSYKSVDGVLYSKDGKTLICYPQEKKEEKFVCPNGVEYIMSGAFCKNVSIQEIFLPESLKKIGANPFAACKNLKTIAVSTKNEHYTVDGGILYNRDKTALVACPPALQKPDIADTVSKICYAAFSGCEKIYELKLPQELKVLESMAFEGCTRLKSLNIPGGVGKLNLSCFKGCKNLESVTVENSEYYKSVDGILYSFDMYELVYCPEGKIGEIIVPQNVRYILNGAFDNCEKITRVVMPESMENVARAFYGCKSLLNIEIPGNQAILEYGTFEGCTALEWIYLPNNVVIVQENALPSQTMILCEEDSFASFYAEENQREFSYKYNVTVSGKNVKYSNQPFLEKGDIYIHVGETVTALGGSWKWNRSRNCRSAVFENMTVDFEMTRAERTVLNQTELVAMKNVKYKNEEMYMTAAELAGIFGIDCESEGNGVSLFADGNEE